MVPRSPGVDAPAGAGSAPPRVERQRGDRERQAAAADVDLDTRALGRNIPSRIVAYHVPGRMS
ncbi:hypothetical protein ACFWIG_09250, partial [Corynebacterium bovis]|uniref:hypothetical protein n=1 Tax=Corynebacterium bovis TaxID=36808 RepID=UPI00369132EC